MFVVKSEKLNSFRPLSRYGWFPTFSNNAIIAGNLVFPAPLEGWVVSYICDHKGNVYKIIPFPAPLEGWVGSYKDVAEWSVLARVFPAPLEGWVVSYSQTVTTVFNDYLFPAPLEGWVVSYSCLAISSKPRLVSFRPLSRYGWVPTHSLMIQFQQIEICFRPLARLG